MSTTDVVTQPKRVREPLRTVRQSNTPISRRLFEGDDPLTAKKQVPARSVTDKENVDPAIGEDPHKSPRADTPTVVTASSFRAVELSSAYTGLLLRIEQAAKQKIQIKINGSALRRAIGAKIVEWTDRYSRELSITKDPAVPSTSGARILLDTVASPAAGFLAREPIYGWRCTLCHRKNCLRETRCLLCCAFRNHAERLANR